MSPYDAYLERQGQPEDDDSDELIAQGAEAARELRMILDYEPMLEEDDDTEMEAA